MLKLKDKQGNIKSLNSLEIKDQGSLAVTNKYDPTAKDRFKKTIVVDGLEDDLDITAINQAIKDLTNANKIAVGDIIVGDKKVSELYALIQQQGEAIQNLIKQINNQ